jgi:excinuclease ABC subunit C
VFAIQHEGGMTCIQVFFFRTGQNWGNRAYFPKADRVAGPGESLAPSSRSSTTTSRCRG